MSDEPGETESQNYCITVVGTQRVVWGFLNCKGKKT